MVRLNKQLATQTGFEAEKLELDLREGIDLKYGARHLKRAVDRNLVHPLSISSPPSKCAAAT